jgi:sugar lactone lactonase YvrE
MKVEQITVGGALLGEGPLWSAPEQALYWLDIKGGYLHRIANDGGMSSWSAPDLLSCVFLDRRGRLFGAMGRAICEICLEGTGILRAGAEVARLPPLPKHIRFNDGKVAPDGALWVGTMDDEEARADGAWWRVDRSGKVEYLEGGYGVTNGPAFDERQGRTYLTDSAQRTIFVADGWSAEACRRKRVFRAFGDEDGYPDGMTFDASGRLWVAFWDGGCVRAFDPASGGSLLRVSLPASRPTSCVFGGSNLEVLFVTSASVGLHEVSSADGSVFAVTELGASGPPANVFT